MNSNLSIRLGAVSLAALTLTVVVFAFLNFQQRLRFIVPDDGVSWVDATGGVIASAVLPDSPADKAGIRAGDYVVAVRNIPVNRATDVTKVLWHAGPWAELTYKIRRNGELLSLPLISVPSNSPSSIEDYLRVMGLLYLFIGLFIFARRWNAPRAVHFYIFCLVSFVLYSFHYSGKLNSFDWTIYWGNVVALLAQPALLVHFALAFPQRRGAIEGKIAAVYAMPAALLLLHILVATGKLSFAPSVGARNSLDTIEYFYLGVYFLLAAAIFLRSYFRAPSGILRQQLKWTTGGTLAGILPFFACYILPRLTGSNPQGWMKLSVFSLVLIPLSFGYAIIRYRLMDVDIIFKRGLAYTFAGTAVVIIYFSAIALIGELSHKALPAGPGGAIVAVVVAALVFHPLREWLQARLDHFFYRDRLDYRRTLIEFGRALTTQVHLQTLLDSALDRISQTLLVDRIAVFLDAIETSEKFSLARSMGISKNQEMDLSFLEALRQHSYLFFESSHENNQLGESAKDAIAQLQLHYFIPCRLHGRTVAVIGLGKTVDGDYLSSEDLELLSTIAGYVAIAVENARLYQSLEQKALQVERLKDFSENIVESLQIGVLTLDLDDRVESWNPQLENLLGISRAEAVGRKLGDILPADLMGEIAIRSASEHVSGIYKFRLQTREGRHAIANVSIAPLLGKSCSPLGRLILMDDITQRVSLEQQLLQNEKLTSLGLLAAGVAHEVNTPLAVISNYIQMLAKQMPADDPRQKTIEKIVKQTFRASEIVNNLLNFSRTGAAEVAELDLNSVLEETLALVHHPLATSRITVIKTYQQQLPAVLGSTNRLQQVFLNLLMNARDAMPGGGVLEVRTGAHNGSVEVEVADNGAGIPPEHLSRIFDPFFTTKASGRGTGLGLSVSYGIIKEHAGKVDVRSTPGKGTSFRLEFPVARKTVHA